MNGHHIYKNKLNVWAKMWSPITSKCGVQYLFNEQMWYPFVPYRRQMETTFIVKKYKLQTKCPGPKCGIQFSRCVLVYIKRGLMTK